MLPTFLRSTRYSYHNNNNKQKTSIQIYQNILFTIKLKACRYSERSPSNRKGWYTIKTHFPIFIQFVNYSTSQCKRLSQQVDLYLLCQRFIFYESTPTEFYTPWLLIPDDFFQLNTKRYSPHFRKFNHMRCSG